MIYIDKDPSLKTLLIQEAMQARGHYSGALDNWWGGKSEAALAKCQSEIKETLQLPIAPAVSDDGIALIKHFESCLKPIGDGQFAAYADPAHGWSVPTIGWGTIQYEDGRKVKQGDIISQSRADELLAWEVAGKSAGVANLLDVPVNPDQFAALVSFAYNVGLGNLAKSTLLKGVNAMDFKTAADEFLKWNRAAGQVLAGLTRRRKSERNLFLGIHPYIVKS